MSSVQYSQTPVQSSGSIGDPISRLPVDQSQPTNNELQIVNSLFTKHRGTMDILVEEGKDSLIVGVLFVIFSLPPVNSLIKKVLPMADRSPYILIAIKAVAMMIIFWLVKHFYLSRRNSKPKG